MIGRATEIEVRDLNSQGIEVYICLASLPNDDSDGTETVDIEVQQCTELDQPSLSISKSVELSRYMLDCERDLAVAVVVSNLGQLLLKRLLSPEELTTATFDSDSDDSEDYGSEFDPEMN